MIVKSDATYDSEKCCHKRRKYITFHGVEKTISKNFIKHHQMIAEHNIINVTKGDDVMANSLVQFRTDDNSKIKAASICERLGIDLPTYMRMCMSRLIQGNGISFSMGFDKEPKNHVLEAMKAASRIAENHGISDMTLDEINAEIAEARKLL